MANTGLLILTNPAKVTKLMSLVKKHVQQTLYIQYFPDKNILLSGNCPISSYWKGPRYTQMVTNIYMAASSSLLDVRVLLSTIKYPNVSIINTKKPVEVVIFDEVYNKKQTERFIDNCLANTSTGCSFVYNYEKNDDTTDNTDFSDQESKVYRNVVLGGTFDRLHNGHKILLSEAILHCTEKLTVGVTDTNMLSGKLLWELIEPCPKRVLDVKDFLEDVDSSLKYNVVPINDMYGPTKDDPTLEMIVVSEETKRGGDKVNELRVQNNLSKLNVHVVNLVPDKYSKAHEENKISSSNHRIRLLGTRLQVPKLKGKPLKPYIIGLTGGIASGKSSVADKLQKLGAGLVNCDKVAHDLYLPGKDCFNLITQKFGSYILRSDGYIDRKALGDIVFNDKEQLQQLNEIVWPVILKESKKLVEKLYGEGFNIIVMEAAVLIQANWHDQCHEIWTCIIPPDEAVRRVIERNALTETEAKLRIKVQPSNVEQVNAANVVICTLWSHEFTQEQVQKAWNQLKEFLHDDFKN